MLVVLSGNIDIKRWAMLTLRGTGTYLENGSPCKGVKSAYFHDQNNSADDSCEVF